MPATILSRCQRFTFSRHTISSTSAHLREIAAAEGFTLDPGAPEAISRAATGSMRDALSVLDQLMAYGSTSISLEQVRGLLGATESQEVTALVTALLASDLTSALRVVAAVADQGADLRQFSRDLVERLRALMLLKAGGDPNLLDLGEDDMATLEQQAAAVDLGALLGWVKLFSSLDYQLRTSPYGQLPLELAIVEALAAPAMYGGPSVAAHATTDRRPTNCCHRLLERRAPSAAPPERRAPQHLPRADRCTSSRAPGTERSEPLPPSSGRAASTRCADRRYAAEWPPPTAAPPALVERRQISAHARCCADPQSHRP